MPNFHTGRIPATSGAKQMSPDGFAVQANAATMTASAKGSSRRIAIDRSTRHHVSSALTATTGSGRSPLL